MDVDQLGRRLAEIEGAEAALARGAVGAILSHRSPQLVKEFFAGARGLLIVWRQSGRSKKDRN
jgi:hypothetical protein